MSSARNQIARLVQELCEERKVRCTYTQALRAMKREYAARSGVPLEEPDAKIRLGLIAERAADIHTQSNIVIVRKGV